MSRITRFFRILWHRRELRWALKEFGFANLGELEEWVNRPPTEDQGRYLETWTRIMMRRNPQKLIDETIKRERLWRVIDAVSPGSG